MAKTIQFILDGCDISFVAEAPEDITLKQLLKQCDRITPDWCACGITSIKKARYSDQVQTEIMIDYDDIWKVDENAACGILPPEEEIG